MYKSNEYYLEKIEENVDFIIDHMKGVTKEQLEVDPVLQGFHDASSRADLRERQESD